MYKMCMVSKTPLIEDEKVRVLLLAATGDYNRNGAILTNQPVCAWSGFQVVGGLSTKGIIGRNGSVIFEKDIVYDYLNLKISDFTEQEVKLEDFPVFIPNDKLKHPYAKMPNFFINMAYVKEDVYNELVEAYKEHGEILNELFELKVEGRDNLLEEIEPDGAIKSKADIYLSDFFNGCIGYACHLYNTNVFSILKSINKNLSDRNVFELLQSDNIFFEALDRNGVMLTPTPLVGFNGFDDERMAYYKGSLLSYLKTNNNFYDCVKATPNVKIFQEINIKDIEIFFESNDYTEEERQAVQNLKDKFTGQSKVIIEQADLEKYPILKSCLNGQPGDIILVF